MSNVRRSVLEKKTQAEIELALGAEPDLLLMKNSVGQAQFLNERTGQIYYVPYGLGEGSPDLVALLFSSRLKLGVWFCIEVKADEGSLEPPQEKCHEVWRRFGALVYTARSVSEARIALEDARRRVA